MLRNIELLKHPNVFYMIQVYICILLLVLESMEGLKTIINKADNNKFVMDVNIQ